MERKKLKKYRMAVGICGPRVLYTNLIKAYSPEDAARKYLEEGVAEGTVSEITDEKIAEIAKKMHEYEDSKPLNVYYDICGEKVSVGDTVLAVTKYNTIEKGTVSKLTNRGVIIDAGEETFSITVGKRDHKEIAGEDSPFFSKLIKITDTMNTDGDIAVDCTVAYVKISFGVCEGFGFGTVTRITPSYVYIDTDSGEMRKSSEKVNLIRDLSK